MSTAPALHWSSSREAPPDVVRRLREIDPTAALVYLHDGRWVLGSVRWNRHAVERAQRIVGLALEAVALRIPQNKNAKIRIDTASRDRLEIALLAMQGFRPITEFRFSGVPDGRIVESFRQMDWLWRHTSDDEFYRAEDAPRERALAAARADIADPERARDAWRYAFTRSHLITRSDDPMRPAAPRAGFTRVAVPPLSS